MESNELIKVFGKKNIPEILSKLLLFDKTISKDDWFS